MRPRRLVWPLLALALAATECRSLDGLTGGEPPEDAGVDPGDAPVDTAEDFATQPCTPTPGTATLCVTVHADADSTFPGYGAFSGSGTVGADGTGFVQVYLFDKDPTEPKNGHVLPKVTLRYPPAAGAKTTVDKLPAELVGTAAAGAYWVYALFEDNDVDARGTGLLSTLPGDLVTPLDILGPTLYPKMSLLMDQVQTLDIALRPLRKLSVNISAADSVIAMAQGNASIHGDGPASIFVYDGNMATGAPDMKDFGQINCMNLDLQNPSKPASVSVSIGVESTGTHSVFSSLYDYANPPIVGNLPAGTLSSSAMTAPQVTIDPTQWLASADLEYVTVVNPNPAGTTDPLHCN